MQLKEIKTLNDFTIRALSPNDLNDVKTIIDLNQMFPSDMLYDMVSPFFEDDDCEEFWLVLGDEKPLGIAYCAPEKMTEGTWNLLLIAIHPEHHGCGLGSKLIADVEQKLAAQKQRILLVETSGLPDFELTRKFYHKCHYEQQACIRDYYEDGDDKIVFWKRLNQS